jgi:hypothetical protein
MCPCRRQRIDACFAPSGGLPPLHLGRGHMLAPNLLPPVRDQRTPTRFRHLDQEAPAQAVSNIVDGR